MSQRESEDMSPHVTSPEIIDVHSENVDKTGFFCFMSKRKSEGYQRKLRWLKGRFAEGMRIKMLALPERGFIEYIPGERGPSAPKHSSKSDAEGTTSWHRGR